MKKTKTVLAVALLFGAIVVAQRGAPKEHKGKFHHELTVEQLATLKTKKMTLALDLSEKQQQQILEFNVANVQFRKDKIAERMEKKQVEERSEPTSEERFAMENARLDHMIAQQQELKKILTDEQFDLWKKMQLQKHAHNRRNKQRENRRG